jgi:hypothetical protein
MAVRRRVPPPDRSRHWIGYLIPGEVKVFDLADEADAAAWITLSPRRRR